LISPLPNHAPVAALSGISLKAPREAKLGTIKDLNYRYTTEFVDLGCMANVQWGPTGTTSSGDRGDLLFDIDVYKTNITAAVEAKTLKHHFTKMRGAKNQIFFSTLTDKALARYR
jgi:uncharacterized protein (TIGR04255 family)